SDLGDDAFEAEPAGMFEDQRAILGEILAEAQATWSTGKQAGQGCLAFGERLLAQIPPVEMQQVEGVEQEPLVPTGTELGLEGREIRSAGVVLDHTSSIDVCRSGREGGCGGGDIWT